MGCSPGPCPELPRPRPEVHPAGPALGPGRGVPSPGKLRAERLCPSPAGWPAPLPTPSWGIWQGFPMTSREMLQSPELCWHPGLGGLPAGTGPWGRRLQAGECAQQQVSACAPTSP